jgi:hypothetical protein
MRGYPWMGWDRPRANGIRGAAKRESAKRKSLTEEFLRHRQVRNDYV